MRILAIDTSALVASCAIVEDNKTIAEYTLNFKMTHSQTIMPIIDSIIKMTDVDMSSIDYIACSEGPGSFTGLRIGGATAKGLALGYNIPIIPVPTIMALAYNIFNTDKYICPIMDARRNQVYTGIFSWEKGCIVEVSDMEATTIDEIIEKALKLDKEVIFLGDGVEVYREKISQHDKFSFAPPNVSHQRASSVGALALTLAKEKAVIGKEFAPVYFRKAQAERELLEKMNGGTNG